MYEAVHKGPVGHIELVMGPMFAGKTTELQRRIKRYQIANQRCVVIKYAGDDRYTCKSVACTHDRQEVEAVPARVLHEVHEIVQDYDVVAVDEGQFFPDVVAKSDEWANQGKIVVVCALDGTFERKPFNHILELVPIAEKVTKLTAVCKLCFQDAHFSRRLVEDKRVEMIGGEDLYIPVCRQCFHADLRSSPGKRGG